MRALIIIVVALVGATACPKKAPQSAEQSPQAKLASDLAVMASGKPLDVADAAKTGARIADGGLTVEEYVDSLLKKPLGPKLSKDLVVASGTGVKDRHPIPAHSTLRYSKDEGVYFLRKKCEASEAVEVEAWWDEKVKICPDSYRPEVKGDSHGRTCGASMLAPRDEDICGCGPKLVYCTKDEKHFERMQSDVHQELIETAGYVVDNDFPIEKLFTMNETVRNKNAEALYRRARVLAGESENILPVEDFGDSPKLAPRVEQIPGQHAGVLSAPSMVYASDAIRGVMRNYYDYLWCSGISSSGVTTQAVKDLKVVDLRVGDGWKDLAAMNICTDCHARLDYGMQFFWGYPSSTMGVDFRPADARKGKGPLYGRNIDDPRGEDDLTPAGFARLVTAQPEFGKCMTRKIVDHVFNGTDSNDDFKAVHETFESTHKVKAMLKTAMLRYAEANKDGPAPPALPTREVTAGVADAEGKVKISKALRELLDESCMSCHDKDDDHDFNGDALPHRTLALMLDQVGFAAMPKTAAGIDENERLAFVHELSAHVFTDAKQRAIAEAYFGNGMRGYPVHRWRSAMNSVHDRVDHGSGGFSPHSIESAIDQSQMRYSPSVAVASGVVAAKACKDEGHKGDELVACVERATAPGTVVVGSLVPGAAAGGKEGKEGKRKSSGGE